MSRDLNLLHPIVKDQALKLQSLAQETLGLRVIFTQTLRTSAEQNAFYAQGRQSLSEVNRLRSIAGMNPIGAKEASMKITNAKSGSSFHEYGLAFDIAITSPDGRKIIWDHTSDWNNDGVDDWWQLGLFADELGLEWGGHFSNYDAPHYQNSFGITINELQKAGIPVGQTFMDAHKFKGKTR